MGEKHDVTLTFSIKRITFFLSLLFTPRSGFPSAQGFVLFHTPNPTQKQLSLRSQPEGEDPGLAPEHGMGDFRRYLETPRPLSPARFLGEDPHDPRLLTSGSQEGTDGVLSPNTGLSQ